MKNRVFVVAVLVFAFGVLAMAADDPFVGTWKLDVAKSKFETIRGIKNQTLRIETHGKGLKLVSDSIDLDGKNRHEEITPGPDGTNYTMTVTGTDSQIIPVRLTRADQNKLDMGSRQYVVSKDGKKLTWTYNLKNDKGESVSNTRIFDKQ